MKKSIKRILAVALTSMLVLSFGACNSTSTTSSANSESKTESVADSKKAVTIGVIQYAPHPSLDNCYTGFKEGLAEGGYVEGKNLTINFQNSQGETTNADMLAKTMVSSKVDLIGAIATPAAMSAYAATKDSKIPVVFTAVSDPEGAGIVKSNEKPETNCTGTSDKLDLDKQVKLIRAFLPDAKKIGVVYTTSEPNSIAQLALLKEVCKDYNFEVEEMGIATGSEVGTATNALIAKGVDCFNNFTDNTVVDNLTTMLHATDTAKIPVFGSEEEQVKNGCLATQGIDYIALGKETGKMAAKVLDGSAKIEDLSVLVASECQPFYNSEVAKKFGIEVPKEFSNATDVKA